MVLRNVFWRKQLLVWNLMQAYQWFRVLNLPETCTRSESVDPLMIRAFSRTLHRSESSCVEFRCYWKNSQTFRLTIQAIKKKYSRFTRASKELQHFVRSLRMNLSISDFSSRRSPTFNVDLVNVLYISVFYTDDWGTSGGGGAILSATLPSTQDARSCRPDTALLAARRFTE